MADGLSRRSITPGALRTFVLTVYALAALLAPLSHHDLACHLKSPTHCTTCVTGSSIECASGASDLARVGLTDAGRAHSWAAPRVDSILLGSVPGRAPPASF